MSSLNGKTALVAGTSRGIGRATALALARAGVQVLVHYGTGLQEAESAVAEIRKGGGRAQAIQADLSTSNGPHELATVARGIVGTAWISRWPTPGYRRWPPSTPALAARWIPPAE